MDETQLPPIPPLPLRRPLLRRAWDRFVTDPSSARNAIYLIIAADVFAVLVGGLIIWTLDREEYEEITTAFWYILQTVTTVGYGDVTPVRPIGRTIGAAVMLLAIASLSILTAMITSSFIEARQRGRRDEDAARQAANWKALDTRLDEIVARLDRLEHPADPVRDGPDA